MCFILVADMHNENIPELDKFRALQSRSQITFSADGAPEVQDEYVETQYYRELHSIDKQHHTTGRGFIRGWEQKVKVDTRYLSCRTAKMAQVGCRALNPEAILQQTIGFQRSTKIRSLSPQNQIGARTLRCVGRMELSRKGLSTNFPCNFFNR